MTALLGLGSLFQHEIRCWKSRFYFSILDGDDGRNGDSYLQGWMGTAYPSSIPFPNLKSLALVITEILKETPKYLGAPVAQSYAHFLVWV